MLSRRRPSWLNSVYRTRLCSYGTFPLPQRVTFTFDHADVISLQLSICTFTAVSCTPPFLHASFPADALTREVESAQVPVLLTCDSMVGMEHR